MTIMQEEPEYGSSITIRQGKKTFFVEYDVYMLYNEGGSRGVQRIEITSYTDALGNEKVFAKGKESLEKKILQLERKKIKKENEKLKKEDELLKKLPDAELKKIGKWLEINNKRSGQIIRSLQG